MLFLYHYCFAMSSSKTHCREYYTSAAVRSQREAHYSILDDERNPVLLTLTPSFVILGDPLDDERNPVLLTLPDGFQFTISSQHFHACDVVFFIFSSFNAC